MAVIKRQQSKLWQVRLQNKYPERGLLYHTTFSQTLGIIAEEREGNNSKRLSSELTVVETQCPRHDQIEAGKTPEMSLASSSTLNRDDIGK